MKIADSTLAINSIFYRGIVEIETGVFPATYVRCNSSTMQISYDENGRTKYLAVYDGLTAWSTSNHFGLNTKREMDKGMVELLSRQRLSNELLDLRMFTCRVVQTDPDVQNEEFVEFEVYKNADSDSLVARKRFWLSSKTQLPTMAQTTVKDGEITYELVDTFDDYRVVQGIPQPFSIERRINGRLVFKFLANEVRYNDGCESISSLGQN